MASKLAGQSAAVGGRGRGRGGKKDMEPTGNEKKRRTVPVRHLHFFLLADTLGNGLKKERRPKTTRVQEGECTFHNSPNMSYVYL